jgi:hypothetical protein
MRASEVTMLPIMVAMVTHGETHMKKVRLLKKLPNGTKIILVHRKSGAIFWGVKRDQCIEIWPGRPDFCSTCTLRSLNDVQRDYTAFVR